MAGPLGGVSDKKGARLNEESSAERSERTKTEAAVPVPLGGVSDDPAVTVHNYESESTDTGLSDSVSDPGSEDDQSPGATPPAGLSQNQEVAFTMMVAGASDQVIADDREVKTSTVAGWRKDWSL